MRAWFFFLGFGLRRQLRARLLVIVSLGLLAIVALIVQLSTRADRWTLADWRTPPAKGQIRSDRPPLADVVDVVAALPLTPVAESGVVAIIGSWRAAMIEAVALRTFTAAIIVAMLASFLMPLWTLTFANEALGRARETRTLTWFLLRPLPRWSMYLAGYASALPGALLLNMGGYVLFGLLGGAPGRLALPLYGSSILLGTLAFTALFQLLSVTFRRADILGLTYAFFVEMLASNLPGQQKRLSISYYVRCLIVDRADEAGMTLDLGGTRPVVSGTTAIVVLISATIALLIAGTIVFSRKQYVENDGA